MSHSTCAPGQHWTIDVDMGDDHPRKGDPVKFRAEVTLDPAGEVTSMSVTVF